MPRINSQTPFQVESAFAPFRVITPEAVITNSMSEEITDSSKLKPQVVRRVTFKCSDSEEEKSSAPEISADSSPSDCESSSSDYDSSSDSDSSSIRFDSDSSSFEFDSDSSSSSGSDS